MSDDYDTGETEAPADPLSQFTGLFKSPQGQSFAQEAAIRLNDYAQKRQIAEANTAAGQAFTDNIHEMRGNFIGMVRDDPSPPAVNLALDLAHLGVSAMVGTIPGMDPEHVQNISQGVQQDIARNAVTTLADRHEDLARQMLDHPRVSELLGDEKDQLSGYITGQATARKIDAMGAQREAQQAQQQQANQTAWSYMAAMVDPDTGDISHPPGWAGRVMADQSMPPHYRAGLFDVYGRLMENGDAPASDPDTMHDMVRGAANGTLHPIAALGAAGDDLKAADAVYLSKLAGDPAQRGRAGQIADALDMGREQLAAPENGPAGLRAFQGFSSSLLAAARSGADLDPSSKTYALGGNRLQQFAPRANYNVEAAIQVPPQERRPLADIFGGARVRPTS